LVSPCLLIERPAIYEAETLFAGFALAITADRTVFRTVFKFPFHIAARTVAAKFAVAGAGTVLPEITGLVTANRLIAVWTAGHHFHVTALAVHTDLAVREILSAISFVAGHQTPERIDATVTIRDTELQFVAATLTITADRAVEGTVFLLATGTQPVTTEGTIIDTGTVQPLALDTDTVATLCFRIVAALVAIAVGCAYE
jgi:hypothetical protein